MLSKSLIQFSVNGWGCVPSLLFDLRPNYDRGNEDNVNLLQKVLYTHCSTQGPQACSRPPPTHASAGDCWTLTGKSGSVSCGVTAPFSWVLVHIKFCALQESVFPQSWVSSGSSMVGLLATPFKKTYTIPRSVAPRAPAPVAGHCLPVPSQEILKQSSGSVSAGSLGPDVHKVCLSPLSVSGG